MSFAPHRNSPPPRRPVILSAAGALLAVASSAWSAMSPVRSGQPANPPAALSADETAAAEIAAREIADAEQTHPWSPEPTWLRPPTIDLHAPPEPEPPPAPIPLPPAFMVGPVFVTAVLAGAAIKRRRRVAAGRR